MAFSEPYSVIAFCPLRMKSDPGLPMTPGAAVASQHLQLITGASTASIKSSPIPPRRLLATAPKRLYPIGASGLSATDCPTRPSGLASPRRGNRRLHSQGPTPSKSAPTARHRSPSRRPDGLVPSEQNPAPGSIALRAQRSGGPQSPPNARPNRAIPDQHDVRGRPLVGWPQIRPRPVGVCDNRRGDRERPGQSQSESAHSGLPCRGGLSHPFHNDLPETSLLAYPVEPG